MPLTEMMPLLAWAERLPCRELTAVLSTPAIRQTGVYVLTYGPLYDASYVVDTLCWIITAINLYRALPKKLKGLCESANVFKMFRKSRDEQHWSVVRDRLLNMSGVGRLPATPTPTRLPLFARPTTNLSASACTSPT